MADVVMPQLGETVTEGTITQWFKQVGESVDMDEPLFEVSTDKVDSEVPSPIGGVVTEILAAEGDVVEVGTVLCRVGEAGDAPAPAPAAAAPAPAPEAPAPEPATAPPEPAATPAPAASDQAAPAASGDAAPAASGSGKLLSPVVRRLINENNLDVAAITGTGLGGRITRSDVEQVIQAGGGSAPAAAPAAASVPASVPAAAPALASAPAAAKPVGARGSVEPLNNIRKRTGEHMVMSKTVSPHVLTAIEVDFEGVERVRQAHKAAFKAEEGFSLTYLPFITRALSDALREYPRMNASVGEGEIVVHGQINVAIAVDINFEGLLAPVVRDVDEKRLRAIARDISEVANRTRNKQLSPDDLSGGTFTITNPGQYGTLMQFPIINQPQVAILSTDGISRKPVVVTDQFGAESLAIHSVGVLALAWDHRAFDGAYAAAFLNRLRDIIETHDWESEL